MIKKQSSISPSDRDMMLDLPPLIKPSSEATPKINAAKKLKGISLKAVFLFILMGHMIAATPIIMSVLKILLPIILEIERSELPFAAAKVLMIISGIEVPIDTIVSPITISGIRNLFPNADEPVTKRFAP